MGDYLERIADHGVDVGGGKCFSSSKSTMRQYRERRVESAED
jgi:hypothetical protein